VNGADRLGLVACGLAVSSLVEPRISFLGPWSSLACLAALRLSARDGLNPRLLPSLVGLFAGIIAGTGYNLGADTLGYLATAASLLQDLDLDRANQLMAWGQPAPVAGPAGMAVNHQPVGHAFIWAGPALIAHGYVKLTGLHAANFISPPYLGMMIAANLGIALSGALALARLLARAFGPAAAVLAVAIAVLASPIVFYLTVQPLMAHGLAFGFACWAIVLVVRASETDAASDWAWAGAALGAATACRFQAAVLFAIVPILGSREPRALPRRALCVLMPAALLLLPQAGVFLKTYGQAFAIPQGQGFMDWSSPHWPETLFSADHGLFNWHPTLLLGLLGLLLPGPALARAAVAGVAILVLTTWTNGAVLDFEGGDAFGARRYDLVVPFFAVGLARLLAAITPFMERRPLALPALLLSLSVAWNLSLMADFGTTFTSAAPLDEAAAAQARRLHRGARHVLGWLGPGMRFRIYDAFVGLHTYRNYRPGGDFDLATLEPRFLHAGWSEVRGWEDGTLFRYVLFPEACITIPLEEGFDLRGYVRARAPARIRDQRVTLTLNGNALTEAGLPAAWTEIPFFAPARAWVPGENGFCVRLSKKRPGDEGDDVSYAAAVALVQLP